MNNTKLYPVLITGLRHDGRDIPAGESVELTDDEAGQLMRIKAIGEASVFPGSDMLEFAAAFERLGEDDLNKDGTPKVASVSAAVGRKVTAEEVAAAWAAWKANTSESGDEE